MMFSLIDIKQQLTCPNDYLSFLSFKLFLSILKYTIKFYLSLGRANHPVMTALIPPVQQKLRILVVKVIVFSSKVNQIINMKVLIKPMTNNGTIFFIESKHICNLLMTKPANNAGSKPIEKPKKIKANIIFITSGNSCKDKSPSTKNSIVILDE